MHHCFDEAEWHADGSLEVVANVEQHEGTAAMPNTAGAMVEGGAQENSEEQLQKLSQQSFLLADRARLDCMVTVVDALNFYDKLASVEKVCDQKEAQETEYEQGDAFGDMVENQRKTLADLLIEQIEFANVILLNKMDLQTDARKMEQVLLRIKHCSVSF